MKKPVRLACHSLALLLLLSLRLLAADPIGSLELVEGSKLWLEGDSNIHDFESTATVLKFDSEVLLNENGNESNTSAPRRDGALAGKLARLVLTVPIKEMKSSTRGLASQLHRTLKVKTQSDIVFTMQNYALHQDTEQPDMYIMLVDGNLALGGVTNPINVQMTGYLKDDQLEVIGEKNLLMTDYGIPPPSLMFGRIKVMDEIEIKWELKFKLKNSGKEVVSHGMTARDPKVHI